MQSNTGQNKDRGDGDGLGRVNQGPGGSRRGVGRKRLHEGGYRNVQNILWKDITVHTDVFNEWVKDLYGFTNNSDFAGFLLGIRHLTMRVRQRQRKGVSVLTSGHIDLRMRI